MVEEERKKNSLNLLSVISKTIDRQVLGLATTIAWYNHHRLIVFPKDNLFQVTVGGLLILEIWSNLKISTTKKKNIGKDFLKNLVKKKIFTVRKIFSLWKIFLVKFLVNSRNLCRKTTPLEEDFLRRVLVVLEIKTSTKKTKKKKKKVRV